MYDLTDATIKKRVKTPKGPDGYSLRSSTYADIVEKLYKANKTAARLRKKKSKKKPRSKSAQ